MAGLLLVLETAVDLVIASENHEKLVKNEYKRAETRLSSSGRD